MATIDAERINTMIVTIARQLKDGDLVAQGVGTVLVTTSFMLARLTHAPGLTVMSGVGNCTYRDFVQLSLAGYERQILDKSIYYYSFTELAGDYHEVISCRMVEFFRPAQIDAYGNFNCTVIGDYNRPKVRLPGAVGIPDVTPVNQSMFFYTPTHNRRTFVEQLDFRSGVGFMEGQDQAYRDGLGITSRGPSLVITDLCVLGFDSASSRMMLKSLHAGVTLEEVRDSTGFDLVVPREIPTTEPATSEEMRLVDQVVDPLGIRRLEYYPGGPQRDELILSILAREEALMGA